MKFIYFLNLFIFSLQASNSLDCLLRSYKLNQANSNIFKGKPRIELLEQNQAKRTVYIYDSGKEQVPEILAISKYEAQMPEKLQKLKQLFMDNPKLSLGKTVEEMGLKLEKEVLDVGIIPENLLSQFSKFPQQDAKYRIYRFKIRDGEKLHPYATILEVYNPSSIKPEVTLIDRSQISSGGNRFINEVMNELRSY